LKRKIQSK